MDLDLVVVPYESGRRGVGVGAGPEHLLRGGLAESLSRAGHGVRTVSIEAPEAENGREVSASFALMVQVSRAVSAARQAHRLPLVLSGNCSVAAVGAVAAIEDPTAVLWLDAHGDLNTPETTGSGFFDGMALSILLGRCWTGMASRIPRFRPLVAKNVALVGVRDLDPGEAEVLARGEVRAVEAASLRAQLPAALQALEGVASAYLHVDLDVLDASEGKANAYAAAGGLTVDDVIWTIGQAAANLPVGAVSLTAYDPTCDGDGLILAAGLRIAEAVAALR